MEKYLVKLVFKKYLIDIWDNLLKVNKNEIYFIIKL